MAIVSARSVTGQDAVDTVWLQPTRSTAEQRSWYPGAITQLKGEIHHFDAKALRITTLDESTETAVASHRVLWIELGTMSDNEAAVTGLLDRRERLDSLRPLEAALRDDLPRWRKQWLMLRTANSMWQVSRSPLALSLCRVADPPPLFLAWFPVAWTRLDPEPRATDLNQQKLGTMTAEMQLVSISWQLRSLGGERALAMIDRLTQDASSVEVKQLAEVLRWRLATPREVIANADKWQAHVDALPMVLQVGPTLTLIEKFEAAGLADRAERLKLSLKLTPPFPHPDLQRP
tara:strand:+ start:538120 stop:538989 length:870 start_codon:yes stop_codon:yes gene_type:complete